MVSVVETTQMTADSLRLERSAGFDLAGAGLHQRASDVPGG